MKPKLFILSTFRELLLPHYKTFEFRAKIFTAFLLAKKQIVQRDYDKIAQIAAEIYGSDATKSQILVVLTKEYVKKAKNNKNLGLDDCLRDISRELKTAKRYAKKVDFEHLRRLISEDDEDDALIQQRVYEFLVSEVKLYL